MRKAIQRKQELVNEFVTLIDKYPVIGIVDVTSLPAKQLQKMREKLREKVVLKMTKLTLLNRALEKSNKKNIIDMKTYVNGMAMVLFSEENPFSLFKILKENKSSAPAKAGQTAPRDIIVPKGGTNIAPGPMISQLGSFGIKTAVENGKIAIREDSIAAKEGTLITGKLAEVLSRLGIEPMEIGLNLTVIYENGELLTKKVLDINIEEYLENLVLAYNNAFALAMKLKILNKETVTVLIKEAYRESSILGVEKNILEKDIIDKILAKAHAQSSSLYNKVHGVKTNSSELPKEEQKEEKVEDKKNDDEDNSSIGMGALFG